MKKCKTCTHFEVMYYGDGSVMPMGICRLLPRILELTDTKFINKEQLCVTEEFGCSAHKTLEQIIYTVKADELVLFDLLKFLGEKKTGEIISFIGMDERRAAYILGKWTDRGWWSFGVSVFGGWFSVDVSRITMVIAEHTVT